MDIAQNIQLFQELARCGSDIYTWCYDADGQLLRSNCPDEALLGTAFSLFGCKDQMLRYAGGESAPVVLGTAIGLSWGAAFEKEEGRLRRAWAIGPVFSLDVSMRGIETGLRRYDNLELSLAWKHQLLKVLPKVPVAQNILFSRLILMLHYCLSGQRLEAGDVYFHGAPGPPAPGGGAGAGQPRDRHKVWAAEQAMLQMVRTGDLNYRAALENSILISDGVPVQGSDPLRQARDSIIVFASIVCRAAIEGGLSPEQAYSLGDAYIQSVESAASLSDLTAIGPAMYDDFVRRVHKCRTNPRLSAQIQKCCDYIEMNLDKKVQAADLAALAGYTEYYLTRKFKAEVGCSVADYAKFAKVERAKVLLAGGGQSVQDIASQLGFGSRNYFSSTFRLITGHSPAQYREAHFGG